MKKILVIEDTYEVRDNLCEILELAGYEVVDAENGKIGVKKAIEHQPDLILCDVMMPELDGYGVLKILNKNPKTNDIPLMFLTAKAEKTDFRKGMGLGAVDYLTKPFDDTELLEAIEMRMARAERVKKSFDGTEQGLQSFFSEAKAKKELEKLSEDREIRKFQKKDLIYQEGQQARWLYFVVTGNIKVFSINDFGKELIKNVVKPGEFFGYFPLLNNTKYADNAAALEDTEIRLIPKDDFSMLLFNNRDFSAKFIKMLANRAEETEKQLIELAYSSVRKRVANALIALATTDTKNIFSEQLPNISREDLASLAGTAKETLIRTLSDFKNEGIIQSNGSQIIIQDFSSLESMPQ